MEDEPSSEVVEATTVLRFVDVATEALAAAREEVDALNVYPVPDGDTGTNLFLTFSAARDAARDAAREAAGEAGGEGGAEARVRVLHAFARGALLGARGNSGVILAEMLGAISRRIVAAAPGERKATVIAEALRAAAEASYAAVGEPVEGTMLTVARAAADAAEARAAQGPVRAREVVVSAAAAARDALGHTPEQLPVLASAGVVDAGGRGITVILDAAESTLTGRRPSPAPSRSGSRLPTPSTVGAEPLGDADAHLTADGPSYEVMYLLDTDDEQVPALRAALAPLGDSLVVVGGEGLWNVHVHVDDVGAAIEAGLAAGRPHRVRVTHFADQRARASAPSRRARTGRRVVAVAAGPGLTRLFTEAGAVAVETVPGRRPTTAELVEAISGCGASEVIVLPNDHESLRTAQVAAGTAEADEGLRVAVIPSHAQVQGLAALAVHEPGRSFESDVLEMTATARHARHGAVTIAARQAMTMAGPCEPGDVLGVVAGDFVVVGDDLLAVATEVIGRLLAGGGELVTLVGGADSGDLAARAAAWVDAAHPAVDVLRYDGGQERYPLLVAVE